MNPFLKSEGVTLRRWWRRLGGGGRCCGWLWLGMVGWALGIMVSGGVGMSLDRRWYEGAVVLGVGVAWAVGVALASGLPVVGYLVAGVWLGWQAVVLMGAWTGTPWVALPLLWWLVVGWAVLAWRGPQGRVVSRMLGLGLALGSGYLLAEPLGWSRWGPAWLGRAIWIGQLVVGGGLAVVGWRLQGKWKHLAWTEPRFGKVLGGSLAVMGVGLVGVVLRDAEASRGWIEGVAEGGRFLAWLGWFWLGGLSAVGLVLGLEACGEWLEPLGAAGGRGFMSALRVLARKAGRWMLPTLWLLVTGMEWLATHQGIGLTRGRLLAELTEWLETWPLTWRLVAAAHAWVGVVVLALGVGWWWQGTERPPLRRLNALWIAAFFCLAAVMPALPHGVGLDMYGWGVIGWIGPVAVLIVGSVLAVTFLVEENAPQGGGISARALAGMVLILGGLLAEKGLGGSVGATSCRIAALLGMGQVALPALLYRWWNAGRGGEEKLPISAQVWLSVLGMVGVLPLFQREAATISQMAYCPIFWLLVLCWLRRLRPALDAAAGTLAGGILGSASVAAWCRPDLLLPEVPLFSWLNLSASVASRLDEPPHAVLQPTYFILLLTMTSVGALLGAMVFREKEDVGPFLTPDLLGPTGGSTSP